MTDGSQLSVNLGGYSSDGDPIGGAASITLFSDENHWFRVDRSYDKQSPNWTTEEKRYNNGLFYTTKDGLGGERQETTKFPSPCLVVGRTIPIRLTYRDGKVQCYAGERRVREQKVDLGDFYVELGVSAPKGVKVEAWFDNLIVEGVIPD